MIDFNQVNAAISVDVDYVLSKLDEVQIFLYYFGKFELGDVYPSRFRRDRNPSTGFYYNKNKSLIYNDFKTGEKLNCFAFVAKLHSISYIEAVKKVAVDFGLIRGNASAAAQKILNQNIEFDKEEKVQKIIQVTPGKWQSHHINYWKQYEVTVDELKRENVFPVEKLYINKAPKGVDELCFAYVVDEVVNGKTVNTYLKIYQPYSEERKWLSNTPINIPFGMKNLKYGTDHVIISKAQKDRLVLLKLFPSVIGTQNESESALQNELVKHLCFHFPRRTIIWDADETGVTNCTKFNSRGFGYFNTPKCYLERGIKDVSDYVKQFGLEALEIILKEKQIL
jgi:hypothetical protein